MDTGIIFWGGGGWRVLNNRAEELTSGNILKTSVVMGRIPLVSTSYRSLVPAGVFLLVVNRKDGALQQRDRDILQWAEKSKELSVS